MMAAAVQLPELQPVRALGPKPARPYLSSVHQAAHSASLQSNHYSCISPCVHFSVLCSFSGNEASAVERNWNPMWEAFANASKVGSNYRAAATIADPIEDCSRLLLMILQQLTQSSCKAALTKSQAAHPTRPIHFSALCAPLPVAVDVPS